MVIGFHYTLFIVTIFKRVCIFLASACRNGHRLISAFCSTVSVLNKVLNKALIVSLV